MEEQKKHAALADRLAVQRPSQPPLVPQNTPYVQNPSTPVPPNHQQLSQAQLASLEARLFENAQQANNQAAQTQPPAQQGMERQDELPSLFQPPEQQNQIPYSNPAKKFAFSLAGTVCLGTISLFLWPQEPSMPRSSAAPLASRSFTFSGEEKQSLFAQETGITTAKLILPPSIPASKENKNSDATLNQLEKSLEDIPSPPPTLLKEVDRKVTLALDLSKAGASDNNDKMQRLTDGVVKALSNLNETKGPNAAGLGQSVDKLRDSLSTLVKEAEAQGKGTKSVEKLLEEAFEKKTAQTPQCA